MIDLRLRAYAPNGAALGLLPDALDLQVGLPLADVSSLTVSYSRRVAGGTVLERDLGQGLELAVEYTTGGAWTEPRNGRFLYLKRSFDLVDDTDTMRATCPGYAWQLRKARLEHKAGVAPVDGKRPFLSATTGGILATLLAEAKARGEITGFTTTATSTHDSAGLPWAQVITIYYEPGLDLWTILDNLTQQGMCDWAMQGRELQLYNPDTALAVDRTTGADPTTLRLGRDVTNAPSDESIEDLISRAVLRGDNGLLLVEDNPTAPTPWGVWTGTISQGGVSDEGTARALAQADLARGARVRGQYTRELIITGPTPPLTVYGPGDYVMAAGATRTLERLRVRQVSLSKGVAGVTGNVVLNDRVLEAELRRSRRISGIVGGASSDGGSGARPTVPGPDRRKPQTPAGLVVDSDAYIDGAGMPRAAVTASWAPVTHATDGTVLEGVSYVLWGRPAVSAGAWRSLLTSDATTVSTSPFDVGSSWQFRVQAMSAGGVSSEFSSAVTVTMEDDTTPPPVPSAPVLTSRLGAITVAWDGLTNTPGTAMPRDFERVEVRGGVPGSPGDVIGTLRASSGSDFLVVTEAPYGVEQAFWFRAVDRSGNESAWSSPSTITVTPLVDADLVGTTIEQAIEDARDLADAAQTTANGRNTVTYSTAAPTSGTPGKAIGDTWWRRDGNGLLIGQWEWTAFGWVARTLESAMLASLDAGKITTGTLDAARLAAGSISAEKVFIGAPGQNIVPNGAGELGGTYGWGNLTWDPVDCPPSLPGVFRTAPGQGTLNLTSAANGSGWFPVQQGVEYLVEFWVRADLPDSRIYIELRDQTNAQAIATSAPSDDGGQDPGVTPYLATNLVVPTVWTRYSKVITVSSTSTRARLAGLYFNHPNGAERGAQVWLGGVRMRPRATGSLIVDGAVTARAIAANAVTAAAIAANAVTADAINAGAITGVKIAGDAIDGKTITGALIRTAATGTRTEVSASGVRTFNSAGSVITRIGGNSNGALEVFHDTGQAAIYVGPLSGGAKGVRVAEPGGTTLFNAWVNAAGQGNFLALADSVQLTARADHLKLSSQMANGYVQVNSGLQYFSAPTSTFGANTGISTQPFNVFYKLTSSRRSKVAIEDLDPDLARRLFEVPVRTWFDRTQVEAHAAALEATASGVLSPETVEHAQYAAEWGVPLRRIPGVVAEEVEAAGLEDFVTYEPDPDNPDQQRTAGVMYDRMWTLLIPLVREQDAKVRELEATVTAQAEQLSALAARLDALEETAGTGEAQ